MLQPYIKPYVEKLIINSWQYDMSSPYLVKLWRFIENKKKIIMGTGQKPPPPPNNKEK